MRKLRQYTSVINGAGDQPLSDTLQMPDGSQMPLGAQNNVIQMPAGAQMPGGLQRPGAALQTQIGPGTPVQLPQSRLEQILSQRAGTQLRQFGYDQMGYGRGVVISQTGAVQDDYILGPGDEILVSLRGQENSELRTIVDRNGRVVLPRISPISAMGRSFGSFRQDLEAAVRRAYVATDAFASIGRVRQISVMVSGEVNNPGLRVINGLSSAVDAILLSGGIKKTGSLRRVRIQRSGHEYTVDLYTVLTARGGSSSLRLADGDRILVPLLGPTVAVTGLVRQQGIYELPASAPALSVRELIALAGGEEVRGRYRLSVLQTLPDGRTSLAALAGESGLVHDSEILFVEMGANQASSQATLSGGTGLAGVYPVTPGTKLSDWVRQPGALGPAPYTLFGLISRKDTRTLLRTLHAFTPIAVMHEKEDIALQSDDIVRVLSVDESRLLITTVRDFVQHHVQEQEAIREPLIASSSSGQSPNFSNSIQAIVDTSGTTIEALSGRVVPGRAGGPLGKSEDVFGSAISTPQAAQTRGAPLNFQDESVPAGSYAGNREASTFGQLARQLGVDPLVLVNFLIDHQVTVDGGVRGPGLYIVGPSVTLGDLVMAAGGTVNWSDQRGVELISVAADSTTGQSLTRTSTLPLTAATLASYVVQPQDAFRFNQVYSDVDTGTATVQGEVRFTGTYKLTRGEHLSDLLARSGGLTNVAYPYGTVFLRRSVAAMERMGYLRTAKEVEDELVVAMTRVGDKKIDPATFSSMQVFVNELRTQKALGRISLSADPSMLAAHPELDVLLEPGDVIYIPQRSSTVSVLGQVMQPGSYPYRPGETVATYINRAGGYARFAADDDTFVVLPDGSAHKLDKSWLSFDVDRLPPGSAIVVPRDITPLDLRQTIIDVSQVFSQFAVSIASIAVLSKQ